MKTKTAVSLTALACCLAVAVHAQGISLESAPPVVVKSVPVAGATDVDPALTELRVTFSKTMMDGNWSWSTWGEENYPETTGKPTYLADNRTCVLPVKLQPNKFYAIWLNSDKFKNFKDAAGRPAVPYLLTFFTAGKTSPAEANASGAQQVYRYEIRPGDTLSAIVRAYGEQGISITAEEILKANPGLNPSRLTVGQVIAIPAPANQPQKDAAGASTELLNTDQRLVLVWTDRQFGSFFDARTFDGWSAAERANLEKRLIDALNGPRSTEYYQAIGSLAALRSTNALPKLRAIAFERVDRNNRDRWMAVRALGIIGDKASVSDLIHLVYHGNQNTHWWAQISLVRLTGQNFGGDWNAWGKWWNDSGGQPAYNSQIIRWWSGQAEPDKLAATLNEGDQKFLDSIKPQGL